MTTHRSPAKRPGPTWPRKTVRTNTHCTVDTVPSDQWSWHKLPAEQDTMLSALSSDQSLSTLSTTEHGTKLLVNRSSIDIAIAL